MCSGVRSPCLFFSKLLRRDCFVGLFLDARGSPSATDSNRWASAGEIISRWAKRFHARNLALVSGSKYCKGLVERSPRLVLAASGTLCYIVSRTSYHPSKFTRNLRVSVSWRAFVVLEPLMRSLAPSCHKLSKRSYAAAQFVHDAEDT